MSLHVYLGEQELPVGNTAELLTLLNHAIRQDPVQGELRKNEMSIRLAGTRSSMYLEVQRANEDSFAFCLSKRNRTLLELSTQQGSISVPAYQVLQKEDVILIISCLLSGEALPDAYHQEAVTSRLGKGLDDLGKIS